MSIDYETLKQKVLEAAMECVGRGRGYSQQKPVLEEVASEFGGNMHTMLDLDLQQAILTAGTTFFAKAHFHGGSTSTTLGRRSSTFLKGVARRIRLDNEVHSQ